MKRDKCNECGTARATIGESGVVGKSVYHRDWCMPCYNDSKQVGPRRKHGQELKSRTSINEIALEVSTMAPRKKTNGESATVALTFNGLTASEAKTLLELVHGKKMSKGPKKTTEEEEESEDEEESEEENEDEEESEEEDEPKVTFLQVKKLVDLHGEKQPKKMKALLAGFKLKSTAELKAAKKKWPAVMKKIKASFGKKGK